MNKKHIIAILLIVGILVGGFFGYTQLNKAENQFLLTQSQIGGQLEEDFNQLFNPLKVDFNTQAYRELVKKSPIQNSYQLHINTLEAPLLGFDSMSDIAQKFTIEGSQISDLTGDNYSTYVTFNYLYDNLPLMNGSIFLDENEYLINIPSMAPDYIDLNFASSAGSDALTYQREINALVNDSDYTKTNKALYKALSKSIDEKFITTKKETLSIDGNNIESTKMTLTLTPEAFNNTLVNLSEAIANDESLKQNYKLLMKTTKNYYQSLLTQGNTTMDPSIEEFLSIFDEDFDSIKTLPKTIHIEEPLVISLYTDSKGQLIKEEIPVIQIYTNDLENGEPINEVSFNFGFDYLNFELENVANKAITFSFADKDNTNKVEMSLKNDIISKEDASKEQSIVISMLFTDSFDSNNTVTFNLNRTIEENALQTTGNILVEDYMGIQEILVINQFDMSTETKDNMKDIAIQYDVAIPDESSGNPGINGTVYVNIVKNNDSDFDVNSNIVLNAIAMGMPIMTTDFDFNCSYSTDFDKALLVKPDEASIKRFETAEDLSMYIYTLDFNKLQESDAVMQLMTDVYSPNTTE